MTHESRPKAAPDGAGRRATDGSGGPVAIPDLSGAPIEVLVGALGQSYDDGPGGCPADCRQVRKWTTLARSSALFVQSATEARCFNCGRTWTLWRLRAHVLADARLARRVAAELATS